MTNYSDKITPLITLLGDDCAENRDYIKATSSNLLLSLHISFQGS